MIAKTYERCEQRKKNMLMKAVNILEGYISQLNNKIHDQHVFFQCESIVYLESLRKGSDYIIQVFKSRTHSI